MNIMGELAIIFGLCLAAEGISALLPITMPASVISLLLLLICLLTGLIKERQIHRAGDFFIRNMAFFFVPPCVGLLEHLPTLAACLVPFLIIAVLTTPLIYAVTALAVQLTMRLCRRKEH